MILVDTTVWVEHLRHGLPRLATLLQEGEVLIHPWVASDAEVLLLIERDRLMGRGIGYADAHLLASARLSYCRLWTQDRRLAVMAMEQGLGGRQPERE